MTNRHILLVDDNQIQAVTRRIILEKTSCTVKVASGAMEALQYLANPNLLAGTALIITDHLMPLMNGPEMVNELRGFGVDLPIIVLSGLPDAESEYEGLDVIFRLKPFPPDLLIQLVHEILQDPLTRTA